jgi:hypothetical protein
MDTQNYSCLRFQVPTAKCVKISACLDVRPCRRKIINKTTRRHVPEHRANLKPHSLFFWSRYPLVLDWYAKSMCMTSACLYLTACKCKWSRKKVNLADQWPYTVDLQKQLDTPFVQNVTVFSSFHFSTSCEDERHRKGESVGDIKQTEKVQGGRTRTVSQSVSRFDSYGQDDYRGIWVFSFSRRPELEKPSSRSNLIHFKHALPRVFWRTGQKLTEESEWSKRWTTGFWHQQDCHRTGCLMLCVRQVTSSDFIRQTVCL